MSLTSISHKRTLDEATAFVYSCIWSCKTTDQVNACESMIANLGIIYEKHPQIEVAQKWLFTHIRSRRDELLSHTVRSEFK